MGHPKMNQSKQELRYLIMDQSYTSLLGDSVNAMPCCNFQQTHAQFEIRLLGFSG